MFLHTDTDGVFGHNTLSDVNENFKVQDEGNAVGTASPGTLQACKDACDADANCNSFAYSASSTWCYLKDKGVTADAHGGGDSNYKTYYKSGTPTVATTTTTTTPTLDFNSWSRLVTAASLEGTRIMVAALA